MKNLALSILAVGFIVLMYFKILKIVNWPYQSPKEWWKVLLYFFLALIAAIMAIVI